MGSIIVAIDGSDESRRALDWAIEAACLRSADIVLVHAYEYTPLWQLYGFEGMSVPDVQYVTQEDDAAQVELASRAEKLLDAVIAAASPRDDVVLRRVVRTDRRPATALLEEAQGAELLVMGSRGRGGFKGMVLGSVSQEVASRATCPVVIISRTAN